MRRSSFAAAKICGTLSSRWDASGTPSRQVSDWVGSPPLSCLLNCCKPVSGGTGAYQVYSPRTPLDLFLQCSRQLSSLARSLFDFPTYLTDVPRLFLLSACNHPALRPLSL